jgi:LAS superfamily LD-carboxypeptidase LdcB
MDFNFLTGRDNKELVDLDGNLIHKDVVESFKKLQLKAKDEIGANLQVVSSFRDYSRQEIIWNAKAKGERDLLDSNGNKLDFSRLSQSEILNSILRWSAIPGVSRHHWGCDFDIFDLNNIKKTDVKLVPSESEVGGPMFDLYNWLDEKIKTNDSLSFFRPYNEDFGGVNIERWHISYSPLSEIILDQYSFDIFIKNIEESSIELKDLILKDAENIFQLYLKTISKA